MIFYSRTYFLLFFGCLANVTLSLKFYETRKITFSKKAKKKEKKCSKKGLTNLSELKNFNAYNLKLRSVTS